MIAHGQRTAVVVYGVASLTSHRGDQTVHDCRAMAALRAVFSFFTARTDIIIIVAMLLHLSLQDLHMQG